MSRGNRFFPGSFSGQAAARRALSVALLMGAGGHAMAHDAKAPAPAREEATDNAALAGAESAVARSPQDAMLRAALGQDYLRAGRFIAAAAALHDAVALGDGSPHTLLGLALAQIACGQNRTALGTLDQGASAIPPAELGLALALAGDTDNGVTVLTNSVRAGAANAKLRQNLAYAYALAGRWDDARLTAGFDVSPDQVDARLRQWAQTMQQGGERTRIALLLGAPLTTDAPMPAALALNRPVPADPPPIVAQAQPSPEPIAAADVAAPAAAPTSPAPVTPLAAFTPPATPEQPPVPRHHIAQHHGLRLDHAVQLGAYSSARAAQRARWLLIRHNPHLREHQLAIAQSTVHGRSYWRVITAHLDRATAMNTCMGVKHHGGACFVFAIAPAAQRSARAFADTGGRML